MSKISFFDYEGQQISFEFADGNKMINATQMAKPFKGKLVADFLRLKHTVEFIVTLEARYGNSHNGGKHEVLRVIQGGTPELQGTWMDELLALKFVAWLSPHFEIWVFNRIKELFLTGKTKIKETQPGIIKGLRMDVEQLEQQELVNIEIRKDVDFIKEKVEELESKIISVDDHYYTIAGFCNLNKISCPIHKAKEWGKAASKLCSQQNILTGTAHDERFGKVRTYHENILKRVIQPK